jgi:NADP-dependent 3-hydroxy acid dehydrogenase YdfG
MAETTKRTAAITGAGDGIGRALAINLNERGIDLYLCDISQERLDTTVAMLDTTRSSVSTALVDCGNRGDIEAWAATITAENESLDFLFNNAGVAYGAQFREASLETFEWLMNINYWGVVWCIAVWSSGQHLIDFWHGRYCHAKCLQQRKVCGPRFH